MTFTGERVCSRLWRRHLLLAVQQAGQQRVRRWPDPIQWFTSDGGSTVGTPVSLGPNFRTVTGWAESSGIREKPATATGSSSTLGLLPITPGGAVGGMYLDTVRVFNANTVLTSSIDIEPENIILTATAVQVDGDLSVTGTLPLPAQLASGSPFRQQPFHQRQCKHRRRSGRRLQALRQQTTRYGCTTARRSWGSCPRPIQRGCGLTMMLPGHLHTAQHRHERKLAIIAIRRCPQRPETFPTPVRSKTASHRLITPVTSPCR